MNEPNSLLNRIVGCYQLRLTETKENPMYIIIVLNIMWSPNNHKPSTEFYFDLKGSYVDRQGCVVSLLSSS